MFSVLISSHVTKSSHELDRTPFLEDAILSADFYARRWHDTDTTFEVWRGGNCFHVARVEVTPGAVKPEQPAANSA